MDNITVQSSVENFCRVLSVLGVGKISPEILRKAKHQILDPNEAVTVKNIVKNLCRNIICNHDCLNIDKIETKDVFSWLVTIVSKFNVVDSLTLKTILSLEKKHGKSHSLKLENVGNLFLKDFRDNLNDKSVHLNYYYNLKIKSYELNNFEEIVQREKKTRDIKSKLQKAYKNWKEGEITFWKWVKLEKHALFVLPNISETSPVCQMCEVHVLPHFLLLNNQYLLFIKQSTNSKGIFDIDGLFSIS